MNQEEMNQMITETTEKTKEVVEEPTKDEISHDDIGMLLTQRNASQSKDSEYKESENPSEEPQDHVETPTKKRNREDEQDVNVNSKERKTEEETAENLDNEKKEKKEIPSEDILDIDIYNVVPETSNKLIKVCLSGFDLSEDKMAAAKNVEFVELVMDCDVLWLNKKLKRTPKCIQALANSKKIGTGSFQDLINYSNGEPLEKYASKYFEAIRGEWEEKYYEIVDKKGILLKRTRGEVFVELLCVVMDLWYDLKDDFPEYSDSSKEQYVLFKPDRQGSVYLTVNRGEDPLKDQKFDFEIIKVNPECAGKFYADMLDIVNPK